MGSAADAVRSEIAGADVGREDGSIQRHAPLTLALSPRAGERGFSREALFERDQGWHV
jgi:hypothetical protein